MNGVIRLPPPLARLAASRGARSAAASFGLQVVLTGVMLLVSLLLARVLGAGGLGAYANAMAWLQVLLIPAVLGMNQLLVREIAGAQAGDGREHPARLIAWADRLVLGSSLLLAAGAAWLAWLLWYETQPVLVWTLWTVLPALPFWALTRLRQAALRGFHRVLSGQLPELVVRPTLHLVMLAALFLLVGTFTPVAAVGLYVGATVVAFLVGEVLLRRVGVGSDRTPPAVEQRRTWLRAALPLTLVGGLQVLNARTGILLLGIFGEPAEVGIYSVANRWAELITYLLTAVNVVVGPSFARLYRQGDVRGLQRLAVRSARMVLLFSVLAALPLMLFGEAFLLPFGREFVAGDAALSILSVGRLVNAAAGSCGVLLLMTANEEAALKGTALGAVLSVTLSVALIPRWGAVGAAIASTASMAAWNVSLAISVRREIGISSTAFVLRKP